MAELTHPFTLGEPAWWIGPGSDVVTIACPECAGTKAITMILGNGEQLSLACATCGAGYDEPRGWVQRTVFQHAPELFVPRRVSIDGNEIRYSNSTPDATAYRVIDATNLYASETDCQRRCDELNVERAAFEAERTLNNIKSKRRDLAFSAHYWRRKVKDLEDALAAARTRLAVCKAAADMPHAKAEA